MNGWSTFKYIRNRDWSYFSEAYYNNNYLCLLWRSRIVISSLQLLVLSFAMKIGCDINLVKNRILMNFDNFHGYLIS